MAQTKKGDKVEEPEVKTPETPETKEPKPVSPQEEADALRQRAEKAEKSAADWEKEAKAHQTVVSKKDLELQEARQRGGREDEILQRLEMQETYIAALGDKVGGEGDSSFSKTVREAAAKAQRATVLRKMSETDKEVEGLLEGTGLTKKSPELETAGLLYSMGRYDEAVKKVRGVVAKLPPKTEEGKEDKVTETEEERIERLAEEKANAKLEAKGLLTPEGGEPSAAGGRIFTASEVEAMSPDEYAKNYEDIAKAQREGRFKK